MKARKVISLLLSVTMLGSMAVFSANAATTDSEASGYYNQGKYSSQVYNGTDLGSTYSQSSTTWKVWSPSASSIQVKLYKTGSDSESGAGTIGTYNLEKDASFSSNGIWKTTLTGDYKNVYYTYLITNNGSVAETQDVYSKATGVNGNRSMVVDMASTNPDGWSTDNHVLFNNSTEAAVWEVHIRDFSVADNSGVSETNKGKYLGFSESGTKLNSDTSANAVSTGIDYLVEQGINCVQLMPIYDFGSVDESKPSSSSNRNWGYDPVNYNVPEGSYSSNANDGNARITEFKQMIQALHDRGISVVMDVVYNHTYSAEGSCFSKTVPGYYHRMSNASTYVNGSGCGNELATENQMVRNYIAQSVAYWASEYHIDGFRFDLMGCIDCTTMNTVRSTLDNLYTDGSGKKILVYGEPWTGGTSAVVQGATTANAGSLNSRVGLFSDAMRNALTGGTNATDKGWIEGVTTQTGTVVNGTKASIVNSSNTTQTITYADCHDNVALWDHLTRGSYDSTSSTFTNRMKLAYGTILTSQGISFGLAGDEFARTKQGDHNSYKSSDAINQLDWSRVKTYSNLVDYIKGLRLINDVYSPFSDDSLTSRNTMNFVSSYGYVVGFTINNNTSNASNEWGKVAVLLNSGDQGYSINLGSSGWTVVANQDSAGVQSLGTVSGSSYTVPAQSVAILVESSTFSRLKNAEPTYGHLTTEHYVDGVLQKSATATYKTGTTFRATPDQDILYDNKLDSVTGTTTGTVTANMASTVKYYYTSTGVQSGTITVSYVDSTGKKISDDTAYKLRAGDSFELPAVSIQGYQLDTTQYPENTYGTFDGVTRTVKFVYKALSATSTVVHYYNSNNWSSIRCYAYTDGGTEPNGTWDTAKVMTADSSMGSGWYTSTVPASSCYIMFHPTSGSSQDPGQGESGYYASGEVWVNNKVSTFNSTVISSYINVDTGKQIVADETQNFTKVNSTGTYTTSAKSELGTLVAAPVNATGNYTAGTVNVVYLYKTGVTPTDPTTQPTTATQPTTSTEPTTPPVGKEILIGDVNGDTYIDVRDASLIQMVSAELGQLTSDEKIAADTNKDDIVDIRDASNVQFYTAGLQGINSYVGEKVIIVDPTQPTTATEATTVTQPATTQPVTTEPVTTEPPTTPSDTYTIKFTDSQNWGGTIYCYYWETPTSSPVVWPGTAMTEDGVNSYGQKTYSIQVPNNCTNLIFTNNQKKQTNDIAYDGIAKGYYATSTTSSDSYGNTVYKAAPYSD